MTNNKTLIFLILATLCGAFAHAEVKYTSNPDVLDSETEVVQEMTKGVAQETTKGVAQKTTKEMANGVAKETAKKMAQSMVKETTKDVTQDVVKEMTEATAKGFHVIPFPTHVVLGERLNIEQKALLGAIEQASSILEGSVGCITFTPDAAQPEEGYAMKVASDGSVVIQASSRRGFYYGLMTLKQMALTNGLFSCEIVDAPKLQHRGLMLDIARHFFGMAQIKKIIDVMSLYKLNRFHLHLTDDQGWRVAIPEYPRLTEVGAVRKASLVNSIGTDGLYDNTEYGRGCYYTLDELREIVAYAAARQVDVMPEIDLPGHMAAAVASYPELSCDPSLKYEVRVDAGISRDLLAVHKPEVIAFLKCVLGHVAEVFPFEYIHIGGDECNVGKSSWQTLYDKGDAAFMAFMNAHHLESVNDIQAWLADLLGRYLDERYGKKIVVWNEVVSHWRNDYLKPCAVMCYSAGQEWERQSAERDMHSISTPTFPLYFDMMQGTTRLEDPYKGGYGNNSVEKVYTYPILAVYGDRAHYCLGAQGNLWTESCHTDEAADYCLFPRGIALSENCWMAETAKSWSNFRTRLQSHTAILDPLNVSYATQEFDLPSPTTEDLVREYLIDSHPDEAGYPKAAAYEALTQALAKGDNLSSALEAFSADSNLVCPKAGQYYQILSASTYWKQHYRGAAIYAANDSALHIHYTPQNQPDEVFCLVPRGNHNAYDIIAAQSGRKLQLDANGAKLVDASTPTPPITLLRPSPITSDGTAITFRPGIIALSSGSYVLSTDDTGVVKSSASPATYTHPTTWYLRQVTITPEDAFFKP